MARKIAITTESAADIPSEEQKRLNIHVIPINVLVGEEEFKDGVTVTPEEMLEKCRAYGAAAKTSGVSTHEYKLVFQTFCEKGYDVVHIALSGRLSSCCQNAQFAANGLDGVYVVDSYSVSAGMAMLAYEAARLRGEGKDAKTIADGLEKLRTKINLSFLPQNADALIESGRFSALEKLGAQLLSIRPCLQMRDGAFVSDKKFAGKEADEKYIDFLLEQAKPAEGKDCFFGYCAELSERADSLTARLEESGRFGRVIPFEIGCCVSAHCGEGCVGAAYQEI